MQRRLTTILAADIAGYSRLMAADEEGVVDRLKAIRSEVFDPAVQAGGGRVVKTMGDGLLIEFLSPVEAVRAALKIQNAINDTEAETPEDDRMLFRIGVHFGDVMVDGDDLLGDVVNIAARLETLAPIGGLCVSRGVCDMIRGKVQAELTDLGPQLVKNIPDPVDVWRVEVAGAKDPAPQRAGKPPTIAVLPFDNLSRDPEQDFLADGVVEDVISELSRFRSLIVLSRAATAAHADDPRDVRAVARQLGADYVVAGSVRRAGDRLRLMAQLSDAKSGATIWSERFDRLMGDLFDLQDELCAAIVTAVEPELGAHERRLAQRKPPASLTAWELYQRAAGEFFTYTTQSAEMARDLADRALVADPDMAAAHILLTRIHIFFSMEGEEADAAGHMATALSHAEAALSLDPRSADACYAHGFALGVLERTAEAIRSFERGVALNPNSASLRSHLAIVLIAPGCERADEAVRHAETAMRLNPADPFAWTFRFIRDLALTQRGDDFDYEASLAEIANLPNIDWKPMILGAVHALMRGDDARAEELLARALTLSPNLTLGRAKRYAGQVLRLERFAPQAERLVEMGLPRN